MNNNMLFMEPKTTQYGSHMVMTNVNKPTKIKYLNIDTRFRDEYNYNDDSIFNTTFPDKYKYNITLPEIITDVKSVMVRSIEVPMTFYNISENLGNNYFKIYNNQYPVLGYIHITIPDGYYTISTLVNAINVIFDRDININYPNTENTFYLTAIQISYDADKNSFYFNNITSISTGNSIFTFDFTPKDKYNFKSSLGWILGFRNISYTLPISSTLYSDVNQLNIVTSLTELTSYPQYPPYPKYIYLALDEYSKNMQNSFVTPVFNAFLNKNIIARITLDPTTHPYGTILPANLLNGLLVSDTRNYNGKVNLHRFNFQILNETGSPIDLNGYDFSLCLEIEYE
jgi:hypothetical protein